MHDFMAHLLTPASEAIWESSGYVITEEGEFSLEPTNEEEWERVWPVNIKKYNLNIENNDKY